MANSKGGLGMYMRLQIAYALEFAIWGCWSYMLGGWGEANHVNPGWLYSAFAFGALFAPVFGPIADSKYSAQKVFAFMQFLCGVALLACSFLAKSAASAAAEKIATNPDYVGSPGVPWLIAMFFAGLMFMPSIPLLNAIVFKHIPNDKKAPFVFIFGTLGWIAINLILGIKALNGLETFFLIDGAIAIVLAIYALTLPDTPPAGSVNKDPFGLKAVSFLLSKRASFVFLLCATMVGIFGSNYYFPLVDPCFPGKGVFNQYSEIIFMAALAFAVAKIGLRWVLTLGMLTWGIRYYFFSTGNDSLALAGILLHGIAYAFLYTAAYMYGDKIAPKEMKASVQALIAFLLLGVAQVLSGIAVSEAKDRYKVGAVDDAPAVESTEKASADTEAFYFFSTPAFAQDELTLPEVEETNELAQVAQDVQEAAADVAQAAEDVAADAQEAVADAVEDAQEVAQEVTQDVEETVADTIEDVKDAAEEALNKAEDVAEEVAETAEDVADDVVDAAAGAADSVKEKVEKQTKGVWDQEVLKKYDWKKIWGYPAYFCLFWAVIFLLLGSEPKSPEDAE